MSSRILKIRPWRLQLAVRRQLCPEYDQLNHVDQNLRDLSRLTGPVDGWLSIREGHLLYELACQSATSGCIVEIGSWKGKSTVWIAKGSQAGPQSPVYAIDPHMGSAEQRKTGDAISTFEEFQRNIETCGVSELITPMVMTSEEAARDWKKPVSFLFIDGAHDYEFVKLDFDLWHSHLIEGGMIAFHDSTNWDGPKRVVRDCIFKSEHFTDVKVIDSITYASKSGKKSFSEKSKVHYRLILKTVFT